MVIRSSCLGPGFTSAPKDRRYCHSCGLVVRTSQRGIQSVQLRVAVCERPAVRTADKSYLRHITLFGEDTYGMAKIRMSQFEYSRQLAPLMTPEIVAAVGDMR